MALRELLAKFGFDVDTQPLEHGEKGVNHFAESIEGIGAKLGAAVLLGGMFEFTQGLVEVGSELDDQSQRLGISTDELQAWRFAAGQGGTSAEEMGASLKLLSKNIAEAAGGGGPAKDFSELGIEVKDASGQVREANDVMLEVADSIANAATQSEKTAIALKLMGKGGAALLPLMKEGSKGIQAYFKRFQDLGGGLSKDFVHAADEAGDAQEELGVSVMSLKDRIGIHLLPAVTWVVHKLTDFSIALRKTLENTNVMKVGLALLGVAAGVAALEFAPLFLEIASIAIPLALLALAIEDVYTLMTGGHSAIGTFIDGMYGVGASAYTVTQLKEAWDEVVTVIKSVWPVLEFLGTQTVSFLKDMFGGFQGYGKMFEEFFMFLGEDVKKAWKSVLDYISQTLQDSMKSGILAKFSLQGGEIAAARAKFEALDAAEKVDASRYGGNGFASGGSVAPPVTQTNTTTIQIAGAGDPAAVADKVAAAQTQTNQQNLTAIGAVARP